MKEKVIEFLHQSNLIEGVNAPTNDALKAWEVLEGKEYLTKELLLEVHYELLKNLDPRIAGEYRNCNVRVGPTLMPAWYEVPRRMQNWLYYAVHTDLEAADRKTKEDVIRQMHIDFEEIHPFEDGNGRVGRIILNWQRVNAGLPILIIHEGAEQQEYYKWFK